MSSNRIDQLSIASEGPRQTPHQEFGLTLARTLGQVTATGLQLASPVAGAVSPALSAAVSQGASVVSSFLRTSTVPGSISTNSGNHVLNTSTPSTAAPGSGNTALTSSGEDPLSMSGGTDSSAMLQMQQAMSAESQQFDMQYLQLQDNMQRESREYETLSNVMKVRNDSAKNAINNIH